MRFLPLLALCIAAGVARTDPFTYQGRLTTGGSPASGLFDFEFHLYDAASGGAFVSGPLTFLDESVLDGLASIELDFGNGSYDGPRWLQIGVRNASEDGPFTALNPRQAINPSPFAIEHLNEPWAAIADGVAFGDGDDRAFVNRTDPVTANEFFGITTPESAGYGGMYINTSGPGGVPFYGYAIGGLPQAWTQYDPAADEWQVNMPAPALTVDNSGNTTANSFRYRSPKTRYYSVQGSTATAPEQFRISGIFNSSWLQNPGAGYLRVPVHIPDGAILKDIVFYYTDNAPGDLDFKLYQVAHATSAASTIASRFSSGALAGVQSFSSTAFDLGNPGADVVVDNQTYAYHVVAFSGAWPGDQTLNFVSVVVEYTVDETD